MSSKLRSWRLSTDGSLAKDLSIICGNDDEAKKAKQTLNTAQSALLVMVIIHLTPSVAKKPVGYGSSKICNK